MRWRHAAMMTALGVVCCAAAASSASAQRQPTGFLHPERDRELRARLANRESIAFERALDPVFKADRVSHVANGVAMRDRSRGFIHLRGVPAGSRVVASFLFWNLSDQKREGSDAMAILLDGNLVTGKKTADNTDPCWGHAGNHSYLAEVTPFTNQSGGPNQDYEVTLTFGERTSTGGQNPWIAGGTAETLIEGATLIVVFRNESTVGPLYLFAPPGDNMFISSATYLLATPALGSGLFTSIGADGQRGIGHDNGSSNEVTLFDMNQIAGPPVAASDWDGSDGLTLPQLWDTHTHIVELRNQISQVDYKAGADCLVSVGFVLDQE